MDEMSWLVVVMCFATVNSQLQPETYDYCDPELHLCDVYTDHTMCKFPVPGPSSRCTPEIQEPLSPTEKKRILFWHNKFRSNVANGSERNKNRKLPTSSNMRQLYWDKELEMISERWAQQCISTSEPKPFDICRNTKRFQVSQNVGTRRVNSSAIDKQAPQMVISWYKESKDFDPTLIDGFRTLKEDKAATKQFANMIWADAYAIGCARVIFQEEPSMAGAEITKTGLWTAERLVCNYGPAGNETNKPIYKRGIPCKECPAGTECSVVFPGLCATQSDDKSEGLQNFENQELKDDTKMASYTTTEPTTQESGPVGSDSETASAAVKAGGEAEGNSSSNVGYTEDESEEDDGEEEREEEEEEAKAGKERTETELNEIDVPCSGNDCWKMTTSPHPRHHRIEEIMNAPKPTGDKYLVKHGLYINGKCHCADVYRSGGRKLSQHNRLAIYILLGNWWQMMNVLL